MNDWIVVKIALKFVHSLQIAYPLNYKLCYSFENIIE